MGHLDINGGIIFNMNRSLHGDSSSRAIIRTNLEIEFEASLKRKVLSAD